MSIIDTLITDRTQADVNRALTLSAKGWAAMTAAEKEEFEAGMKGAYNATDLNRVNAAMEYLEARFKAMGYTGGYYQRVKVPHKQSGGGSVLPEGYTQVEYIQSSGTQYIDTGFKPNQNSRATLKVNVLSSSPAACAIFGARNGSSSSGGGSFVLWGISGSFRADYASTSYSFSVPSTGEHEADYNQNTVQIDSYTHAFTARTFQANPNLLLFAVNNNGEPDTRQVHAQLEYAKIYDNGTLIRDFVPCQDPTGNVGLYDLVGAQFYSNAGSGSFTAGPEVEAPDTPDEPGESLDPYTWYKEDVPPPETMSAYLANVQRLRDALGALPATPQVPDSMETSTIQEWNDIEAILIDVETVINALSAVFQRAGTPWAVAGNNIYIKN